MSAGRNRTGAGFSRSIVASSITVTDGENTVTIDDGAPSVPSWYNAASVRFYGPGEFAEDPHAGFLEQVTDGDGATPGNVATLTLGVGYPSSSERFPGPRIQLFSPPVDGGAADGGTVLVGDRFGTDGVELQARELVQVVTGDPLGPEFRGPAMIAAPPSAVLTGTYQWLPERQPKMLGTTVVGVANGAGSLAVSWLPGAFGVSVYSVVVGYGDAVNNTGTPTPVLVTGGGCTVVGLVPGGLCRLNIIAMGV